MNVRRAALAALVAVAVVLPSGAAHADPCADAPPPCEEVVDFLNSMCEVDLCLVPPFGPENCPVYAALSPGVPGVADITPEGDLYVDGDRVWDCPPYGWP